MAKKLKGEQVFTGQLLRSGDVVFMTADGDWLADLQKAEIATNREEVDALEEKTHRGIEDNIVVDVYPLVIIREADGSITPAHIREKLRTKGPSINYGYDAGSDSRDGI